MIVMARSRENVSLESTRLRLREHVVGDWPIIDSYAHEERFWRYLQIGELKRGSAKGFIEKVLEERKQDLRCDYNLAVILKEKDRLIGSFRLGAINHAKRKATLGYALNPAFWAQGYATEAVGRLIEFGFRDLGLHRIAASCDRENHASRRVMEKNGMTREGLMREDDIQGGEWHSSFLYAILEHEMGVGAKNLTGDYQWRP